MAEELASSLANRLGVTVSAEDARQLIQTNAMLKSFQNKLKALKEKLLPTMQAQGELFIDGTKIFYMEPNKRLVYDFKKIRDSLVQQYGFSPEKATAILMKSARSVSIPAHIRVMSPETLNKISTSLKRARDLKKGLTNGASIR